MRALLIILSSALALGCSNNSGAPSEGQSNVGSGGGGGARSYDSKADSKANKPLAKRPKRTTGRHATATFAAGCFWCVEAVFEHVRGVDEVVSGYAGGPEKNPTYQQVAAGKTGHAEAVRIFYDPDAVTYETLVRVLLGSMDPTQVNGQGPDTGRQYRSAIFFHDDEQRATATRVLAAARSKYNKPLAIELTLPGKFWPAEDYHQDYEARNPNDGYIKAVSRPRLEAFKKNFPDLLAQH